LGSGAIEELGGTTGGLFGVEDHGLAYRRREGGREITLLVIV